MSTKKSLLSIVFGNFLYALTVQLFLVPSGLATGGTTGMALAVNHLTGLPVSVFVFTFNLLMLITGFLILGKTFALTTLASSFLYPIFLNLCERTLGNVVLTTDPVLCTLFTGMGIGAALGIVLKEGASTGGMDIPPLVLRKFFRIPVAVSMYAFDVCILLLQAAILPAESILYGVILVMTYTIVLDKMLLIGRTRTEVKIVSMNHYKEICDAILHKIDRGVTLINGEGGYLHGQTQLIFSVVNNRELIRLEKIVHDIDPECFMVVSRVSEVKGRGFSMNKKYEKEKN